jgi:hypothetical protein
MVAIVLFVLGGLCNLAVTEANGGNMPVLQNERTYEGPGYVPMTEHTRLNFLGDRFMLTNIMGRGEWSCSIGDVFIICSVPIAAFSMVCLAVLLVRFFFAVIRYYYTKSGTR